MRDLTGKVALVTGGARRIGRSLVQALASAGVSVVVHHHRSADEAEEVAAAARRSGVQAWTAGADLLDPDAPRRLLETARAEAGRLDILINNASIYPESRLRTVTPGALEANVRLHVSAPLALAQGFAATSGGGDILNLLDARITSYDAAHAAYHLSKRMLFTLTRMLALELAPAFRVNAVAPGLVLPPEGEGGEFLARLAPCNPLQSHGSAEGVAETAIFLLRSDFITGQVIFYDGGYHMKGATYG